MRPAADVALMTAPREILPGRTYLVTRRCTQRQYLLRPDEKTNAIYAYCLGLAAERSGVQLIAWCAMSNHHHAVVHDPQARLPVFLEHLHKMLARALNARWSRWENLWSTEQTCVTYLPTADAIFEKVCYVLSNPTVDGLVDRLVDWPGCTALHHLDGRRTKHDRPRGFFRPDGPTPASVELVATQPPCSAAHESAEAWAARVRNAVAEAELISREKRIREGARVMGRKEVLRASAFDSPGTPAARRNLHPAVACRDKQVRIATLQQLIAFRSRYTEARTRYYAGETNIEFPAGTYRFRTIGLPCAPYPVLAIAA